MGEKRELEQMSTKALVNMMWDELIPAWLGASAGSFLLLGAPFWRFVIYAPSLVIDYGDYAVWSFQGELVQGTTPPETSVYADLLTVLVMGAGIFGLWWFPRKWRACRDELRRRRYDD